MKAFETIRAWGHPSIKATHSTTFEITREDEVSKRGDCIIAVSADKALADLSRNFRRCLRNLDARIEISITTEKVEDVVRARGSPQLSLTHSTDVVVRKSDYACGRTLAVYADKASCDLSRVLVEQLKNSAQEVKIDLAVERPT